MLASFSEQLTEWKSDWDNFLMIPKGYGEPYSDEFTPDLIDATKKWIPILQDIHESLDLHANPNMMEKEGKFGHTAIHYSALRASCKAIKRLFMAGGDPNVRNKLHQTPLMMATEYNSPFHRQMVLKLLAEGANPSCYDQIGNCALLNAVYNQDVEMVKILLGHGAKVERDVQFLTFEMDSPIDVARFMVRTMKEMSLKVQRVVKKDWAWRMSNTFHQYVYEPPPPWGKMEIILQLLEEAHAAQQRGESLPSGDHYLFPAIQAAKEHLLELSRWFILRIWQPKRLCTGANIQASPEMTLVEEFETRRKQKIQERKKEIKDKHHRKKQKKLFVEQERFSLERKQNALKEVKLEDSYSLEDYQRHVKRPDGCYKKSQSGHRWVVDKCTKPKLYAAVQNNIHTIDLTLDDVHDTMYI